MAKPHTSSRQPLLPVLAAFAAMAAASVGPSRAQEAIPAAASGFVLPPLAGPALDALSVEVKGFSFDGNTVFSTAALQALVADAVGRLLDPSALDEVRERINRLYVEAGYLNSGALLAAPPGDIPEDGIVAFRIVEGKVDAVRLRGLGRLDPRYVQSRLLREGEPLNIDRLQERFRLLLADPLFDKINSRIVPGDAPGAAVLDVEVERARPYSLDIFVNNYRPPSVGSTAVGLHGVVRNLTGTGDALEGTVQHTEGGDPFRVGWSMAPLGQGTRVFASYDRSVSAVVEENLVPIDIKSRSSGAEVGIGQTVTDTLARRIELTLAYGRRRNASTLLGLPFSFTPGEVDGISETRAWRFSQDWTERWEAQAVALRSVFSFGSNNIDPASAQAVDPASVPSHRYLVWTGQAQYLRSGIVTGGDLRLRGSAQYSPDRLVALEQFAVGGVATVRGYRENAVLRDRGYAASAEYRHALQARDESGKSLTVFAFVDVGGGANTNGPWQRLSSLGAGLSWQIGSLTVDLSYAKRLTSLDNPSRGNLQDRGIQFQLSYRVL